MGAIARSVCVVSSDGSVATRAGEAVEDGIVFISAAGNDAHRHYQAVYLDIDPGDPENNLHDFGASAGEESDEVDWSPDVELTMTSEVANRYFQGKESVALALARRRIKVRGDLQAALAVAPIVKPAFARYVELIERSYPHLRL